MLVLRVQYSCATAKGTVLRSLSCPKRSACLAGILPRTSDLGMVPMRLPRPSGGGADVPVPILHDHGEVEHWGVDGRRRRYRLDEYGHKLTTTGTARP